MARIKPQVDVGAAKIKAFVLDVDGTLTDGRIIVDDDGRESKNFFVRDGYAIAVARKKGFIFAIISGRYSKVVEKRGEELKFHDIHQDIDDKLKMLKSFMKKHSLSSDEVAFMGDDINDIAVMEEVGIAAAPEDACVEAQHTAHFVSGYKGGYGAVREFIEYVLRIQNNWP